MKKAITCLLAMLGLNSACGQLQYETTDVEGFAKLTDNPDVTVVDVRTADEYAGGHIVGAVNIDVNSSDFMDKAKSLLSKGRQIAMYCRSGRRSANAADKLSSAGYKVVNLKGGITAWISKDKKVTTDTHETDLFVTLSGKTVRFYALMHASIRIEYDGIEIEVDPVGRLGNRSTDYSSLPKADYILVTHEHGDHFDQGAINTLSGANTSIITNARCRDMMDKGESMANGDSRQLAADIAVEAVPAYNYTEGRTQFHPKGRDNGFVLTLDGLRIYIAGDTEDIPEMADIKDIDIAFMPCNQPYTMTTGQLTNAARIVKPKVLFPYHYGQTDVSAVPAELEGDGIDVRIRHYE